MSLVRFATNLAKVTKTDGGDTYTAADYLYVPDPAQPSTWKLRIAEYVDGKKQVTAAQVGRAAAAFSPGGYRGNPVELPGSAVAGVKRKLRALWKRVNPDTNASDMPEGIALSAAFAVVDAEAGVVRHWGKLFEVGQYASHDFSMTPAELAAAAAAFQPVPVDLEHRPSLLDGKLGTLEEVELSDDSRELYGTVALPAWLDTALGDAARTVSTTWDRATKRLEGLALVTEPRVEDAVLMAAFGAAVPAPPARFQDGPPAFAAPRHDTAQGQLALQRVHDLAASAGAVCKAGNAQMASSHEAKAVQSIHDIAAEHGAVCSAMPKGSKGRVFPVEPLLYSAREKTMGFWDQFKATFGLPTDWQPPADDQPPPPPTAPKADEQQAQLKATQEALFAERAELARLRAQVIHERAGAFADKAIADLRAYPAEKEHLVALYAQAALDDQQLGPVQLGNQPTSRVALLEQEVAARPEHGLTKEQVGALSSTSMHVLLNQQKSADQTEASPERLAKLKAMTPVGQSALRNGSN